MDKQRTRIHQRRRALREADARRTLYREQREQRLRRESSRALWFLVPAYVAFLGFLVARPSLPDLPFLDFPYAVSILFTGMGVLSWLMAGWDVYRRNRVRDWFPVRCIVETTDVFAVPTGDVTVYAPLVYYTYDVEGQTYRSDVVEPDYAPWKAGAAYRVIAPYEPGQHATCYYNPKKPSEAVLVRSVRYGVAITMAVLGALCFGMSVAFILSPFGP